MKIEFCLEEKTEKNEKVCNWYIHITDSDYGFSIRIKDSKHGYPIINSSKFVRKMLSYFGLVKTVCFKISKTPHVINGEKYWLMITSNPIEAK